MRDIDHIAAMTMMGLLANVNMNVRKNTATGIVTTAYEYADEFIRIRDQRDKEANKPPRPDPSIPFRKA